MTRRLRKAATPGGLGRGVGLGLLLLALASAARAQGRTVPAGTELRIRFLDGIESGRSPIRGEVRAQTLQPLEVAGCVVAPAYTLLEGSIATSRAGRSALGRGALRIVFDSVQARPGHWLRLSAELDSLEWSPRRFHRGTAFSGRAAIGWLAAERLALLLEPELAAVEAARLAVVRPRVHVLAGEEASLRLTEALSLPAGFDCLSPAAPAGLVSLPDLAPRATDRSGGESRDPVNVIFVGSGEGLERAFANADWTVAYRSNAAHLARGIGDALLGRRDPRAPVSPQYYDGRVEDVAFERASPSARVRHHVRFWRTDSLLAGDTIWVGAGTRDIGLLVGVRGATHRVDSLIDNERELIVRELQAGGCSRLLGHASLPGATLRGTTVLGQPVVTDGLAAVLRGTDCAADGSRAR